MKLFSSLPTSFLIRLTVILTLLAGGTSCVHEWPHQGQEQEVDLKVSHNLNWRQHDISVSRTSEPQSLARYHFKIYSAGTTDVLVKEYDFTSTDISREDFTYRMTLPAGNYDLYAWSDHADLETTESLFFDSGNFSSISYSGTYKGNDDRRDAFRGMTSFKVDHTIQSEYSVNAELHLDRPFARYEFISNDLEEFIDRESARVNDISLEDYRVKIIYTGYMPSEYNVYVNNPINSLTGMTFEGNVQRINDSEATLGFDHVMVNGDDSSIQVALEILDPEGTVIGSTGTINVPTQRGRNTTVRGKFLTSKATGGVGIDPSFNGEFNIEIK